MSEKQRAWDIAQGYRKRAKKVEEEIIRCICIGTSQTTTAAEKEEAQHRKTYLVKQRENLEKQFSLALQAALKIA